MFCVIDSDGKATPVSDTERGAKNYASRNGYTRIGQISKYSLSVYNCSRKIKGKWYYESNII